MPLFVEIIIISWFVLFQLNAVQKTIGNIALQLVLMVKLDQSKFMTVGKKLEFKIIKLLFLLKKMMQVNIFVTFLKNNLKINAHDTIRQTTP